MKLRAQSDLILLVGATLVSLVLALALPLLWGYRALRYGGYYAISIVLILFCLSGFALWRRFRGVMPKSSREFHVAALVLFASQVGLLILTPDAFRVMDDEAILLNTSLSIHQEKELFAATEGYWVDGEFEITSGNLDKRPFLYAYLLSLLHDLFGYQIENAFLLNAGLSLAVGFFGLRFFVSSFGVMPSFVAMLALVTSPAFLLAANGAGFEMLNFALLSLLGLATRFFIRTKDPLAALFVSFIAVLLSYARYESIFFVLPVGMLLLFYRIGPNKTPLNLGIVLMPFMLVPYVWLYRCTLARVGSWARAEAESLPVFSFQYIPGNMADAVRYFFSFETLSEMNPLLTYGGMLGLILMASQLLRKPKLKITENYERIRTEFFFWALAYSILALVLMTYFWSSFMDVMSQRMALPLFLALTAGLAYFLSTCSDLKWRGSKVVPFILAVCIMGSVPLRLHSVRVKSDRNGLARLQTEKWRWSKSLEVSEQRVLFIDNNPAIWTALRLPAIEWRTAALGLEQAIKHPKPESIDVIYSVQVVNQVGANGRWEVPPSQKLDELLVAPQPEFVLQLTPRTRVMISRVLH